jgi:hypothetical protein
LTFHFFKTSLQLFTLLLMIHVPSLGSAAKELGALMVGERGAILYSRQDVHSDMIARLEKGEELTPIAQVVGPGSWYLVRTKQGAVGWVQSADVAASTRVEETFKDKTTGKLSTWTAVTKTGRVYGGTWTAKADPSTGDVSGSWTLRDETGTTVLSGTWSANKFSTGWNGAWRALVDGYQGEFMGSWTAALRLAREGQLAELFKAAIQEAVRGVWTAGGSSGSWSIRAAE